MSRVSNSLFANLEYCIGGIVEDIGLGDWINKNSFIGVPWLLCCIVLVFRSSIGSSQESIESTHFLYVNERLNGEFLLVAKTSYQNLYVGNISPQIPQTNHKNYYISVSKSGFQASFVSNLVQVGPEFGWRLADSRAHWYFSVDDELLYLLLQSDKRAEDTLVLRMPEYIDELPSLHSKIDSEKIGLDLAREQGVRLAFERSNGRVNLVVQRPGKAANAYIPNILEPATDMVDAYHHQFLIPNDIHRDPRLSLVDTCGFEIDHPDNGQGLKFSRDCTKAYVAPPKVGKITSMLSQGESIEQKCYELEQHSTKLSDEAYISEQGLVKAFKDYSQAAQEKITVSTSYLLDWQDLVQKYRSSNSRVPISSWEPIPVNGVKVGHKIFRKDSYDSFEIEHSTELLEACSKKFLTDEFLSISFQYEPWVERTATVDYIQMASVVGVFNSLPASAYWLEDINFDQALFYNFSAEDPEFAFGDMEQDVIRETYSVRLQEEIAQIIKDKSTVSDDRGADYYFSDCNWFSAVPCMKSYWIPTNSNDVVREKIKPFFTHNGTVAVLRYFRSDLATVEREFTSTYSVANDFKFITRNEGPVSGSRASDHFRPIKVPNRQNKIRDLLRNPNETDYLITADIEFPSSSSQSSLPSNISHCGSIDHPKGFSRVHFSEDCTTAFLAPKNEFSSRMIESSASEQLDSLCESVDKAISTRQSFELSYAKKLGDSSLSMDQRKELQKNLDRIREQDTKIFEIFQSIHGSNYVSEIHMDQDIDQYQQANPSYSWKKLPISSVRMLGGDVSSSDIQHQLMTSASNLQSEGVESCLVKTTTGLESACALRNAPEYEVRTAISPSISLDYYLSSKVKVEAALHYDEEFVSNFFTFDMDFFFISLRSNTLWTKLLHTDLLNIEIDDLGSDLTISDRNHIYLATASRLLRRIHEMNTSIFIGLFDADGPAMSRRRPEFTKEKYKELQRKAYAKCPRGESSASNYEAGTIDTACYSRHLFEVMTKITQITSLHRRIEINLNYDTRDNGMKHYFLPKSVILGSSYENMIGED